MRNLYILVLVLLLPGPLAAQDAPPSDLASAEIARSQACVPALGLLASLDRELDPLSLRIQRLETLGRAIVLEDSSRVAPFDEGDPVEVAARDWFAADAELARRFAEEEDESIPGQRQEARSRMLNRVNEALQAVSQEARDLITSTDGLEEAVATCDGVILIRSAVLEACDDADSPVCEAARAEEPTGRYRFVDEPEMLWDIERMRPWEDPTRLHPSPEGLLGGARSGVMAQRGNTVLLLGIEPILRPRASLPEEEAASYEENLAALGFDFEHPEFVMAPAISVRLEVPSPLAGEDAYLLHFGDLSEPSEQVIHSISAEAKGPVEAVFPAAGWVLDRLAAGDLVRLTAVRLSDPDAEQVEVDPLYTIDLTQVLQAESVGELLSYWSGGGLAEDLTALLESVEPGAG